MTSYAQRLTALKAQYPFDDWVSEELDQYTSEVCAAFTAIFDQLIDRLIAIGEVASEEEKLRAFEDAVAETNILNEEDLSLIESGERDSLCDLFNLVARATGLNPKEYADGEGPASLWRDW